ncbi:MAG: hypothetical protein IT289_05925 [Oligoflexia bacterium]|nr:hypothetical protein [Oligoflexia bacterium]
MSKRKKIAVILGFGFLVVFFQNFSFKADPPTEHTVIYATVLAAHVKNCEKVICSVDNQIQQEVCFVPLGVDLSLLPLESQIEASGYFITNKTDCQAGPAYYIESFKVIKEGAQKSDETKPPQKDPEGIRRKIIIRK